MIPLIAVHLFVFYFGIMADVTPPVGLASYAAAAISGDDPNATGWQATWYSFRTALLPFVFIFNPQILFIGVGMARGGDRVRDAHRRLAAVRGGDDALVPRPLHVARGRAAAGRDFLFFRPDWVIDRFSPRST